MDKPEKYAEFGGRIIMLGFGSIGQAILPLLFRHITLRPDQVRIISRSPDRSGIAAEYGVEFQAQPLTESNYESVLEARCATATSCSTCRSRWPAWN
jgi:homospermidine synthase|nr:saccharopine dehydrogenase NADP-binding domain-containing protein [Massilia sp. Root418]